MSCTVCRLPFVPSKRSTNPHPPPEGILNSKQYSYFEWGICLAAIQPLSTFRKYEYLDDNRFGSPPSAFTPPNIAKWETYYPDQNHSGTVFFAHTTCAHLLRVAMNAPDKTVEHLTDLCEIEKVLGEPGSGICDAAGKRVPAWNAGRLKDVDYEGLSHTTPGMLEGIPYEKINNRSFWRAPASTTDWGRETFDWQALVAKQQTWLLSRPDVFPRFFTTVQASRFPDKPDVSGTLLMSVVGALLPYLPTPDFLALLATCRALRHHALTTFQPEARRRVLALKWAVPLPHEAAPLQKAGHAVVSASTDDAPVDADWLLYLSHVHRTAGMRVRRWVWGLVEEIVSVYRAMKPGSMYADELVDGEVRKSKAREDLEEEVSNFNFLFGIAGEDLTPDMIEKMASEQGFEVEPGEGLLEGQWNTFDMDAEYSKIKMMMSGPEGGISLKPGKGPMKGWGTWDMGEPVQ